MKHRSADERYLGVRLSTEELARLDKVVEERGFSTRSEAVRWILRQAGAPDAVPRSPGEKSPRGRSVEIPVILYRELERSVENGYSSDIGAALEKALERGLEELAHQRSRRVDLERATAERLHQEDADRRSASQEGERHGGK